MANGTTFGEEWSRLLERLAFSNDRLLQELESSWRDLQTVLQSQIDQLQSFSLPDTNQPTIDEFQKTRQQAGRNILTGPLSRWERRRPYRRALKAVENYDRSLEDLIKSLPVSVSVSGQEMLDSLSEWSPSGVTSRLARVRRKPRPLPLQKIVEAEFRELSLLRLKNEWEYFLSLARAIEQAGKPWEAARSAIDSWAQGQPMSASEIEAKINAAKESTEELINEARTVVSNWRSWREIKIRRLAARLLKRAVWRRKTKLIDAAKKRAAAVNHQVEQLRAVEAEGHLELALESCENRVIESFKQGLETACNERAALMSEIEAFIEWLQRRLETGAAEEFPQPQTIIVPALSRLSGLRETIRAAIQSLPETSAITSRLPSSPRRRSKLRKLRPQNTFERAFERTGRAEILLALEEIESEHRKALQEIERAREVVAFGMTAEQSESDTHKEILLEATQNALSLLEFYRSQARDWRPSSEIRMASALAAVFAETRAIFGRDRIGAIAYIARQGLRRGIALAGQGAAAATAEALRKSYAVVERTITSFLIYIGWKQAPQAGKLEVITRPLLPKEYTVDLTLKDLPAIYRRLFRFEAVQDPRFLVGRDREMAAIAEARSLWEEGRPVSLIIVGQRGSGKTSLINCALQHSLAGIELIRGEFRDRLTTGEQLRLFFAEAMGLEDQTQLESFLLEKRRVVILEEMERAFLRQVAHFGAMKSLQRLIAATCSSTLWVLATNQVAFRFLDAALRLGDSFSHRINAATADRDALRQAILLRHNLSGLRLQFALPQVERSLTDRIRDRIRGQVDAETMFFDELAKESAGVFRAAFDIWLGHIDSVEAGMLYMKPLITPNLTPVINDLDLDDLFTMVAILQHGSLTPEEHAAIFQKSIASSRAQIDELLAREIIENDPGRPGYRVRPEAMRVVKEALYRRNLL